MVANAGRSPPPDSCVVVAGDLASVERGSEVVPGVGFVATQGGNHAGERFRRDFEQRERVAGDHRLFFGYVDRVGL
ncbi:hypothetical protein BMS3Bbin02_00945 [bacterium BMS3Bbin02]|nr:hypothetical protein BMS3Bbin02_00945 [bacterium BMS3Bbin02]